MGLKDFKFGGTVVKTTAGDIPVRGLDFDDITKLVRAHTAEVVMLFGEAQSTQGKPAAEQDYTAFTAKVLHTAPTLACAVIAAAADETDEETIQAIRKWPFGVQLTLLNAVGEETFAVDGGAKKVFEIVMGMMHGATGLSNDLRLKNGSTESASK